MLAELLGKAPQIVTDYATRWNAEYFRTEVQCPKCGTWQRLTHNAHCHYCVIDLAYVVTSAPVAATTELAVEETAEPVEVPTQEEVATEPQREPVALHAEYYTVAAGKYTLTCQSKNGLAVDCDCPDRVHRGRLAGRACKHQMAHNHALKSAA
jgi:hypothetical protein